MQLNPPLITTIFTAGLLLCSGLFAEENNGQVPFQELPKETRDILAPFEKHWDRVKPKQKKRLLARAQSTDPEQQKRVRRMAQRLKSLSPEQHKHLREVKRHYDKMPPHERRELRRRFDKMSPKERQTFVNKHINVKGMPKYKQRAVRDKVRDMSPQERRQYLHELNRSEQKHQDEQ